ncbi:5-formyltetrahydrofolate cyclo-ligase [Geomonas subterranea]|uniref:5-formyltetrahydrofolate cyclo-ligase n=1 Tax=Geomonas subterranea TaxID=2847989 RepID=A0ABX8LFM9_9BACT|nr:5-formyltetrahydrofolate cyclo-ligase [Geomonas subterranea]QXE90802.1 5-formyltetrahydrofolate cyclo-ligase [Geomonas subterranea]QXM11116.1 5-formyltetrahydrofolate cyclo-ligase [Geomonas subterranea]
MPKRAHRAATLARRRELSKPQVASLSLALQQRFLDLPEYQAARTLVLYAPIHHEVDTAAVAVAALASGKTLLYPAVAGHDLKFCRVAALAELAPGKYGIPEPEGEGCDPAEADLIVVPGVAFDLCGRRIGYGKGYYDRSLHRLEGSGKLVAFCYDFQLLQEIAGEPHDVTMDLIVTESRVVRVNKHICEGEQQ